jgi:hypothetical protein
MTGLHHKVVIVELAMLGMLVNVLQLAPGLLSAGLFAAHSGVNPSAVRTGSARPAEFDKDQVPDASCGSPTLLKFLLAVAMLATMFTVGTASKRTPETDFRERVVTCGSSHHLRWYEPPQNEPETDFVTSAGRAVNNRGWEVSRG